MNPKNSKIDATIALGDGVAVIRYSRTSTPQVVGVLGIERDEQGEPRKVYLDTLIHAPHHNALGDHWEVSGAVSSILTRVQGEKPGESGQG